MNGEVYAHSGDSSCFVQRQQKRTHVISASLHIKRYYSALLLFSNRVAGQSDTEFFENLAVHFAKHYRRVHLATIKFGELLKGATAVVVRGAKQGECHKHFVGVEAWIASVEE